MQAARRIERDIVLEGDQDDAEPGSSKDSPVADSVCAPEAVLRQLLDKLRTARSKDSVRDPVYPRSPRVRLLSPDDVAAWLDRDSAEACAATEDQISLARTHRNLASVLSRMQRHCSARAHLMQAVALLESVLTDALERRKGKYTADQDENEDPESSHAAALLVAALFAQGAEEERLRAYDGAERTYERGQKLANVTLVPEHPLHSYMDCGAVNASYHALFRRRKGRCPSGLPPRAKHPTVNMKLSRRLVMQALASDKSVVYLPDERKVDEQRSLVRRRQSGFRSWG